jgi:RNA polymerase sigma-70 factor (sigma-E family)
LLDDDEDEVEVAGFCRRLRPRLVGLLRLQVGDAAVAEELAQETLVRVWERWPRVRTLDAPERWAFRVAVNLSTSWWRRRAAERRAQQRHGPARAGEDGVSQGFGQAELRDAVVELPARQRQALVLRFYLQLKAGDAAEVMGCAPATVRVLCHQAVQALQTAGVVEDAVEAVDE